MRTSCLLLALVSFGCAPPAGSDPTPGPTAPAQPVVSEVLLPAPSGARYPTLGAAPDGRVVLSWLEPGDSETSLVFATATPDGTWSGPRVASSGEGRLVNWADVPAVSAGPSHWVAHWLVRSEGAPYAYDAWMARSDDGGASWSPGAPLHEDRSAVEHGFVSALPLPDGSTLAVWLDGRKYADEDAPDETQVLSRVFGADGTGGPEEVLDARSCDCCPTAIAALPGGAVAVWRDRSDAEIRDLAVAVHDGQRWGEVRLPAPDGWELNGCPVNGPAVATAGSRVAIAWFTGEGENPRVRVLLSSDGARTFASPVEVAGGPGVLGRVAVAAYEDGSAVVAWLEEKERVGEEPPEGRLMARALAADGRPGEPVELGPMNPARASGMPRVARTGDELLFVWTDPGEPPSLRAVRLGDR